MRKTSRKPRSKYPTVRAGCRHWFGIVPTDKRIDKYAQAHCILKEDIPEDIFDTMDRDLFINIIVEDALGKGYNRPMNCDSDEYKNKFYPLFYQVAP